MPESVTHPALPSVRCAESPTQRPMGQTRNRDARGSWHSAVPTQTMESYRLLCIVHLTI